MQEPPSGNLPQNGQDKGLRLTDGHRLHSVRSPTKYPTMSAHRFRVGQTVVVPWSGPEAAIPLGPYVIARLLPVEDGEPHYRVRSSVDGHERALLESQIRRQEETSPTVEAPQVRRTQSGHRKNVR